MTNPQWDAFKRTVESELKLPVGDDAKNIFYWQCLRNIHTIEYVIGYLKPLAQNNEMKAQWILAQIDAILDGK